MDANDGASVEWTLAELERVRRKTTLDPDDRLLPGLSSDELASRWRERWGRR
jgi:hypothetical protein